MARLTWAQWQRKVQSWHRKFPSAVHMAIDKTLVEMVGHAQEKHLSGPKMPRGMGSRDHATLQPRTGALRNYMAKRSQSRADRIHGWLINNLKYAAVHEYGRETRPGVKMPERSFARATVDQKKDDLRENIKKAVLRAYGN